MKYTKGTSGNPKGRPKGSKNKTTAVLREWVKQFLANNLDVIEDDFRQLEPNERFRFFLTMLNFALPKQQSEKPQQDDDDEQKTIRFVVAKEDCENINKLKQMGLS